MMNGERVVNKGGHLSLINLQWSNYADNTYNGQRATVKYQSNQVSLVWDKVPEGSAHIFEHTHVPSTHCTG